MSFYYPRAAVKLRILPEDFKLTSDAVNQTPIEVLVLPKKVSITRNDYKTADTFNMKLDYKNFPFDPRIIRSCGVVIYMEDMQGPDKIVPSRDNTVFAGYVDTETVSFDEMNQEVSFEGRDFTCLLIDQKYAINKPVSEQMPLDVAIKEFLGQVPALQQLKIENRTGSTELPSLSSFYPAHADPLNGQRNPGSKESYWSMIQDACNRASLVCFMELQTLVITVPRNQSETRNDDIKFIYGKNVKKLEFKRKLGRLKNINISVRSRAGKEVIIAKIPLEAEQSWCDAFGIKKEEVIVPQLLPTGLIDDQSKGSKVSGDQFVDHAKGVAGQPAPYLSFNIDNVADHAQLVKIGQSTYEQYSLQQLEGTLETREMLGHGPSKNVTGAVSQKAQPGIRSNQAKKYDLTKIKKGQSISIEIDTDDLGHISRFQDYSTRLQYLVNHGYNKKVASIFASSLGKFSPRFFIKSCTISLDSETGFELSINFINILDTKQAGL